MDDITPLTMPRFSETAHEGVLIAWLKGPGDHVDAGEPVAEIEVDKAIEVLDAPADGLLDTLVAEGDTIAAGAVIARIQRRDAPPVETAGGEPEASGRAESAPPSSATPVEPDRRVVVARQLDRPVLASPLARRLAAIHDIDLATVTGSGPGGMILRGDVGQAAGIASPPPAHARTAEPLTGAPDVIPLSRIQRIVAERMTASHATVPTFGLSIDADIGSALDLRRRLAVEIDGAPPPSITDMLIKALALALRAEPRANASHRDGAVAIHRRVNVGLAVAVDDGLLVPVVVDADLLSLAQISRRSRDLIDLARSGVLPASAQEGGTVTLTNVGSLGVDAAVPAVNAPQAAILAAGAARESAIVRDGKLEPGRLMNLTLSADHRVLNGADGARLLAHVRANLEHPLRLLSGVGRRAGPAGA